MKRKAIFPVLSDKHQIVAKTANGDYVLLRFDGVLFVRMRRGKTVARFDKMRDAR